MRFTVMRDPWFPITLLLIFLISVWLGIVGPIPEGFAVWLQHWQTLAAAFVASCAAYIAFRNTNRTLDHAAKLESNRRDRKHAAVRAVLPLALAQVNEYAERSAYALERLVAKCADQLLPTGTIPEDFVKPLPSETLKTLAEFIEYSDAINADLIASIVSWIQIHDARMRSMVTDNNKPSSSRLILKIEIENMIIDAASIYAGAASAFDYARRREPLLPTTPSWNAVRAALRNMRFWDEEHLELYEALSRREKVSKGPFERLTQSR